MNEGRGWVRGAQCRSMLQVGGCGGSSCRDVVSGQSDELLHLPLCQTLIRASRNTRRAVLFRQASYCSGPLSTPDMVRVSDSRCVKARAQLCQPFLFFMPGKMILDCVVTLVMQYFTVYASVLLPTQQKGNKWMHSWVTSVYEPQSYCLLFSTPVSSGEHQKWCHDIDTWGAFVSFQLVVHLPVFVNCHMLQEKIIVKREEQQGIGVIKQNSRRCNYYKYYTI